MRAWPPSPRPPLELEPPVLLRSAAAMTLNSERCSRRREMVVMEVLVVVVAAASDAATSDEPRGSVEARLNIDAIDACDALPFLLLIVRSCVVLSAVVLRDALHDAFEL